MVELATTIFPVVKMPISYSEKKVSITLKAVAATIKLSGVKATINYMVKLAAI